MQVIVEYVLLNNLIINTIIILLTSKLLAERCRFVFLSSLFGSVMALISPLFNLHVLLEVLLKFFIGSIMCCISFSFKSIKKFVLIFSIFILTTILLGGACYVLENIIGRSLPVFVPLSIVLFLWRVLFVLMRIFHKKRSFSSFFFVVCLKAGGICIEEKAYLDSGNTLLDPLTNRPVIVLCDTVFQKLFPKTPRDKLPFAHYISIGTIGEGSKMLLFELDELNIVGRGRYCHVMAGLSATCFEKSFEATVLLHPQLV